MAGISDNIFGPDETLTRAMAASLVYRMYGSPDVTYKALFPDVPDGEWYTDGIIWAKENGVMSGYDDGMFCPDWYMTIEPVSYTHLDVYKRQGCNSLNNIA